MINPDTKPYSPKEVAVFQRSAASSDPSLVPMDPYRVEASIQAAVQRGEEYQRAHDEADLKREHRMLVIAIWAFVIIAGLLFGAVAAIIYNPEALPCAELFDRGP